MESEPWLQQKIRRPSSGPDGVEAWRVAFAACFINFITAGIARTSGILYVEIIDIFHIDRKQASLPFTVRTLTRNLFGPVVGILGQKYGVRPVIIVGGIIGSLSAAACFFVEDIFWMTVVWGFFNGIGAALITTLTQASIGEHFVKHKSTASGMGFSGGCVGSFIFPAVLDFLLNKYSLGGTFLFVAGILMHVIPAAIIMKRPTWLNSRERAQNSVLNKSDVLSNVEEFGNAVTKDSQNESHENNAIKKNEVPSVCNKSISNTAESFCCETNYNKQQLYPIKIQFDLLRKNGPLLINLLTNELNIKCSSQEFCQAEISFEDLLVKEVEDVIREIVADVYNDASISETGCTIYKFPKPNSGLGKTVPLRKSTSYENGCSFSESARISILKSDPIKYLLFTLDSLADINRNDIINFYADDHEEITKVVDELQHIQVLLRHNVSIYSELYNQIDAEKTNTFCSHIKTALQLHTKPLFLLICLCRSSHLLTFMPILTTVVDFSRDTGFPEGYGKYVIAALSGGDLVGRLFTGWITDKKFLSLPRYMFIFMILEGISTALLPVTNSSATLIISLITYGLLQGCVFIQHPVLISRYMRHDEQSIALGCLNFFPGILGFSLPFYIGYFRDNMGSYNGMFYVSGFIACFVGLLWLSEPYLLKISQTNSKRNDKLTEATV